MWTDFVDRYCERLGPGLWAEPFNFLSNLAFFVAAFAAWREVRLLPEKERGPLNVAVALLFVTGVGSSIFHSFATRWAELADVIPIGLFLLYYLWMFLEVLWQADRKTVVKGFLAFGAATAFFAVTCRQPVFNGSQNYFGTLVTLFVMAWATRHRPERVSPYYWGAGGVFFLALTFRCIDMRFCPVWPLGTHFLWHTLNGVVTYLALKAAIVWTRERQA